MAITSTIEPQARTTLPQAVQDHLHIEPGDEVEYELRSNCVILRRSSDRPMVDDPFILFTEWAGEADEAAYGDL